MSAIIITLVLNVIGFTLVYVACLRRIRQEVSGGEIIESIKDEVNALVVELNQTTDRNVSLAEERMSRLKGLVAEADRKIQLVSREIEKHQVGVDVYNHLKASSLRREPNVLSTQSRSEAPVDSALSHDGSDLSARVVELARNGFGARIIAQKLGTTPGEVELILSLKDRRSE